MKVYPPPMLQLGSKNFWRHVRPVGALADLAAVNRLAGRNRWRFGALALLCTWGVFSLLTHEEARIPPKLPQITYITSFAPGRSDAEIMAENIANQKVKDGLAAQQQQRDEEVRNIYKAIGRASGFDVDTMEKQGRAEEAADQKAAAERQAALYGAGKQEDGAPAPRP